MLELRQRTRLAALLVCRDCASLSSRRRLGGTRAMVLETPGQPLREAELPQPEPGPGQVLLEVRGRQRRHLADILNGASRVERGPAGRRRFG
jgi:hypothetical protein